MSVQSDDIPTVAAPPHSGQGGPAGPPQILYQLRGVTKRYAGNVALRVEDLTLTSGRVYGVVGPNGSGKTTLLEILAFLETPSGGDLRYRGEMIWGTPASLRREVTLVLQNPVMLAGTVRGNVLFGLKARGVRRSEAARATREALEAVHLEELAHRRAGTLSGGELQRAAVARALALKPRVLLLDEPFANVDAETSRLISAALPKLARRPGSAVIFSSHEPTLAYGLADEMLTLIDGTLVAGGTENIYSGKLTGEGEEKLFRPLGAASETEPGVAPGTGTEFRVVTERTGSARLLIPPEAVILSTGPLDSSARNLLRGRITSVTEERGILRVVVDVGVPLAAHVTHASAERLGLRPGAEAYASFKATAARVF